MISYKVNWVQTFDLIELQCPDWFDQARKQNEKMHNRKGFVEKKGHWSALKNIYMNTQHYKCAYCERRLEGKIEFDIEHFRPKKKYYLLAYRPKNYIVACKVCNTICKGDDFPLICGSRMYGSDNVEAVENVESPVLVNPLRPDVRPEDIISFVGVVPVAVDKNERASGIIRLLKLDSRYPLIRERAEVICRVWSAFTDLEKSSNEYALHRMRALTADSAVHANCARAFVRTIFSDKRKSSRLASLATKFLSRSSQVWVGELGKP